jgi:hypothetical protein
MPLCWLNLIDKKIWLGSPRKSDNEAWCKLKTQMIKFLASDRNQDKAQDMLAKCVHITYLSTQEANVFGI